MRSLPEAQRSDQKTLRRSEDVLRNPEETPLFTNSALRSRLELEGARRRLLVESLRVSKAAEAEAEEEESEVNVEDLYTQEQLDDMRVAFETFDLDGSGDIDSDELGLVRPRGP